MATTTTPAAFPSDREIVSTRVFDAPRESVFDAFADPAQLARWWGPEGFTNTIHEFDLRPGGAWRITLRGPDGTAYHNEKRFTAVVRPERIIFQHLEPTHHHEMAMSFDAQGGQTLLTWRMLFASATECARVRDFIAAANEQNFDRLAAHLAQPA